MKYPIYLFTLIITLVIVQGQNTVIDVIQNDSQFSSISQFASLLGDLNSTEFLSAFIPTNTAVSEVPPSIINTISSNGLAGKVLKYHLLKGQIQFPNSTNSTSSSNSTTPTIFDIKDSLDNSSGPVYLTSRNGSYFFNNYIRFDPTQGIAAQNATVYPVNKVALADFTLEGFIRLFNDTYLLAALEATGLEDSVDRSGVTLLAPSNQAISTFLQNQNITDIVFDGSTTPDLGSLTPVITNLLRYHVLAGIRSWLEITNDLLLPTGSGGQSQLRFNIYNNDIFTVNGKVIQQGGWIKDSDDNDDNNSDDNNEGPYDDDLAVFRRRTGFFYQLDDVLVPPAYSAYQYIGLISNFSSQIPQSTQDLLTQEAITVFYVRDATELTLYVLNGTVFLPGLFSGTYNTLPINSNQTASSITVSNDGQTVIVQDQFTLISSQLVTNGVVHLLSSSSTGSSSASPSGSEASSGSPSVTETDSLSAILPSASA